MKETQTTSNINHKIITHINHLNMLTSFINRSLAAKFNITRVQIEILGILHQEGAIRMSDLAKHRHLACSTLTRNLDLLVRSGYVQRFQNYKDRRSVKVQLSPLGEEKLKKHQQAQNEFYNELLQNLSTNKQADILRNLEHLREILERKVNE